MEIQRLTLVFLVHCVTSFLLANDKAQRRGFPASAEAPCSPNIIFRYYLIKYSAKAWYAGNEVGSIFAFFAVGKDEKRTIIISAVGST